jgi:colanic acid biosynthesis glycosyl transferase WcaI
MKIHLHDFAGHPFQAQLSRALARRGHEVSHSFSSQYVSGKGALERRPDDPNNLRFSPITAATDFNKYAPAQRLKFEFLYSRALARALSVNPPDVAILCNIPLIAHRRVTACLQRAKIPWVYWHQDICSVAMGQELMQRLPRPVAAPAARYLVSLEKYCLQRAAVVVPIDTGFSDTYRMWGAQDVRPRVIPNWAPLDEIMPMTRENAWAQRNGLPVGRTRLLYSGTLGRKHNPMLLLDLLDKLERNGVAADLTVVSEGDGADLVRQHAMHRDNVRVLPFQTAAALPEVLASADFLVAILEPGAANYSVPSKVLSYLAAGRPIVGLMPEGNAASVALREAGSLVATPAAAGVSAAADWVKRMSSDRAATTLIGNGSRVYAEKHFNIEQVTDEFETVIMQVREQEVRNTNDDVLANR